MKRVLLVFVFSTICVLKSSADGSLYCHKCSYREKSSESHSGDDNFDDCIDSDERMTCQYGEVCYTHATNEGGRLRVTKGCRNYDICHTKQDDNDDYYCDDGFVKRGGDCTRCCAYDFCNDEDYKQSGVSALMFSAVTMVASALTLLL